MQKVIVIGCSGAGKSTFSRQLKQRTNLPLIHLDQEYWHPNWQETPKEAWEKIMKALVLKPQWIMDGNYGGTLDIRIQQADTIIYLDFPTSVCLWRVFTRTLKHWKRKRPDMVEGCLERFNWEFFHYVAYFNKTRRPKLLEKLELVNAKKTSVHILKNNQAVKQFLESISESI